MSAEVWSAQGRASYRGMVEAASAPIRTITCADMRLRISLYIVAALLLGAHFLRAGDLALVALCVAAPLLFLYRARWSLLALQFLAYCATGTWIGVAIRLVEVRQQLGQRWTAAVVILGSVALFTLAAGLLLNARAITQRYPERNGPPDSADPGAARATATGSGESDHG